MNCYLSTNNKLQSTQDTPDQFMTSILVRMGLTKTPADREAIYEEVAKLDNKGGGQDVKDLFLKHRDVIDFLVPLFHIPALHNCLFPSKFVKAKQVVWGVSVPF
jgi:hypothetical protein